MTFSISFYKYFLIWKKVITLSLSLSCLIFVWIFCIFCISTLYWCIYVFFRILLWVAIWFCFINFLFFFSFSMIVKCYSIAYKYSLQKYNIILLYIIAWIIWWLTYDYIFYFDASFSHFISLSLSLSLSISLYIYIYIYIYYLLFFDESLYFCI